MKRLRRVTSTVILGLLGLGLAGCITPFFDSESVTGTRFSLATDLNNLMTQRKYAEVIALAEQHLHEDDPAYRDAIYYVFHARRALFLEQQDRAEKMRKLRNESTLLDVDKKAMVPPAPEEAIPYSRADIVQNGGFTEPFREEPTGEMKEKLLSKIPVLNVIDTDLDYVVYEIFKNSGIKFIIDPGLLRDLKISVRVTDETVLGFLDYLRETQGIDYTIYGNTLRLRPARTGLVTAIFRLRYGFQPYNLKRDFQSLSDLSFINRANEGSGGGGGGGGGGGSQAGGSPGGATGGAQGGRRPSADQSFVEALLEKIPELVDWPDGSQHFVDRQNNSVLVRSSPATLEQVGKLLASADVAPVQISIESRFIEVANLDDFDFGTNLSFDGVEFGTKGGDVGKITLGDSGSFFGSQLTSSDGSTTGGNLFFSGSLDEGDFSAAIFVLDRLESAETLASPSVTCANNSTATLAVVRNLVFIEEYRVEAGSPVSSADQGGLGTNVFQVPSLVATINDENFIGFVLNVTPSVGADGESIALTVQPVVREQVDTITVQSSAVLSTGGDTSGSGTAFVAPDIERPILETRFVNTNLTVRDGSTVVIGGLTRFTDRTVENKIPFLGDIPILGRLFRRDTIQKEKRNLLIFVTARIINPEGGLYSPVRPKAGAGGGASLRER